MTLVDALEEGRRSYDRHAWADAYTSLASADEAEPLAPDDLERLALSARLTGRHAEADRLCERAYSDHVRRGDAVRAARWAFWLGMSLLDRGESGPGGGWLARAQRLLDDGGHDCAERGMLLIPVALRALYAGDLDTANATYREVVRFGDTYHDADLVAFGRLGVGQTMIMRGRIADGVAMLDEAMVAVTAGEVSPVSSGIIYCAVIDACHEVFDLRRAREWTTALTRWCDSQPDMVPFTGQCMVHRAEIMQLHGSWPDALETAERARDRLLQSRQAAVGAALYRIGELKRLRGELTEAVEHYREASHRGHPTQPGLALVRLAQGQVDIALAAIRRALDEADIPLSRPRLLSACVEIMLAANDLTAARDAADELSKIAEDVPGPLLSATAAHGQASVLLAEGDARSALGASRRAWAGWHELDAPYETARARILIGLSCRALGDEDTARMEFDAASWIFRQLGAEPDGARAEALIRGTARAHGPLTAREVEVLRLVASGRTNRAIAAELFLSEKTVARHLSNIFAKLGLSTRAAATAYAYEHDLV